jgi:hypothetical protein
MFMREPDSKAFDLRTSISWVLLAVIVLASSIKTYSIYSTTVDSPELSPMSILSGKASAPNQYRLLAPLAWRGAVLTGMSTETADRAVVIASILLCYLTLSVALYSSCRNVLATAVCVLLFFGASSSGFWFRYRDTFFEVAFTCLGMTLITRDRPKWTLYGVVSAFAALNRETWLLSLAAAGVSRWAHAGSLKDLFVRRKEDVIGLVASTVVAAAVLVATRYSYHTARYHYELWQYPTNLHHFLIGGSLRFAIAHGVWSAGSGIGALWLMFAVRGLARHVPFTIGFVGSLIVVSFFISNWSETRIFFPAYAVLLISVSSSLVTRFECRASALSAIAPL